MKNFISLALVIVLTSSCAQAPWKAPAQSQSDELLSMLSPEELKIHNCLHSKNEITMDLKKECLTGTSYASHISRMPSNDGDDDIVMKNNWFFGDNSKLNEFYSISRGFVKASTKMAKKAINDRGIAVEGSAWFGFGGGWLAEFINHHEKFGLFCAPFAGARTDIGVEAGVAVIQSVSCTSNHAYQGGFLNVSAGLSGELIGLPVDLSLMYNFGLDLPGFAQKVKAAKNNRQINIAALSAEVGRLAQQDVKRAIASNSNYNAAVINLVLKPLSILGIRTPSISSVQQMNQVLRKVLVDHKSLGVQFKAYYKNRLAPYLSSNGFPQLNLFLSMLTSSMTGCDSLGGAASLALSLSPASVGVAYENYHLLFEMPFEDLRAFKVLTPMTLLNPFLMNPEDLRATVRVARGVLAIPLKVSRQCNQLFPKI